MWLAGCSLVPDTQGDSLQLRVKFRPVNMLKPQLKAQVDLKYVCNTEVTIFLVNLLKIKKIKLL